MTENLAISEQELFDEIVEQGLEQGVANQEAFEQLVENTLNDRLDVGELDKDEDTEGMEDRIKARWSEYEQRLSDQVA